MKRDAAAIIHDALTASEEIITLVGAMSEQSFLEDRRTRLAVERLYEIVGEALSRLRREFPELASRILELRDVIDFRNVLAHAYDEVDPRIVWRLTRDHLPQLIQSLQRLR